MFDRYPYNTFDRPEDYDTPKKIYEYLGKYVYKQDAAKKAAAIIAWQAFRRCIKTNAMFIGPTGCGKTHIWRSLKKLFPDRIEIVDGSNATKDSWNSGKKWGNLLSSPIFRSEAQTILVVDEAEYGANVRLSPELRRELADTAYSSGLGVREMQNRIREMLDNELLTTATGGTLSSECRLGGQDMELSFEYAKNGTIDNVRGQ